MSSPSPFFIGARNLELSFTFFYRFVVPEAKEAEETKRRGPLRLRGTAEPPDPYHRPWLNSELAYYVSDGFLNDLLVCHFHVPVTEPTTYAAPDPHDVHENERVAVGFDIPERFPCHEEHLGLDSIGPLECTVFGNGQLTAVLRLVNREPIPAKALVSMIRHPEFSDREASSVALRTGALVAAAIRLIERYEPTIVKCLRALGLEYLSLHAWEWRPYEVSQASLTRSRPYVGTLFRLSDRDIAAADRASVLGRFVVAAGRATPAFVETFQPVVSYLSEGARNVYGPGGSIVFIGRRGWCVYDAGEHNPAAFRLGVVEMTHFVIMAFDTAQRALRSYARSMHEEGGPKFEGLNIMVNFMVRGFRGRWVAIRGVLADHVNWFIERQGSMSFWRKLLLVSRPDFAVKLRLASATSFLARARLVSPSHDLTGLLETHLISHTAKAAVERCKALTGYDELERAAREVVANYSAFLKTSSDYVGLRSFLLTRLTLAIAIGALLVGLIGLVPRELLHSYWSLEHASAARASSRHAAREEIPAEITRDAPDSSSESR